MSTTPTVSAAVTFFYYDDLPAALAWYKHMLGMRSIVASEWYAILEREPGIRIGLVDATRGILPTADEKGVVFALETDELENWRRHLAASSPGTEIGEIISPDAVKIRKFSLKDPEGYVIEFFSWLKAKKIGVTS